MIGATVYDATPDRGDEWQGCDTCSSTERRVLRTARPYRACRPCLEAELGPAERALGRRGVLCRLYASEMSAIDYPEPWVPTEERDMARHTLLRRLERLTYQRGFGGLSRVKAERLWRRANDEFTPTIGDDR